MQRLVKLGLVALVTLPAIAPAATPSPGDFADVRQRLQKYARELRDVAKSMQTHARTAMPTGLGKDQEASLAAQRRDLEATAGAALALASQVEQRESKARSKTLTRADMEGLAAPADALDVRIGQKLSKASTEKKPSSGGLNASISEIESAQESVRNERQTASIAFESFDQKAIQLYQSLSSVSKMLNELRQGAAKNLY